MLKIISHKLVMNKILKGIYSDIEIGPLLGFKGGTALYLFYNLPRFSVGLDFDILDIAKKGIIFEKVTKICQKQGELKISREKYFNLLWMISYEKGQNQLKIELSKRNQDSKYEVKNYFGLPVLVMKKEDMFAHKLTALLNRKVLANRDIYDIWFMASNNWEINIDLLEDRTKLKFKDYIGKCINLLESNPPVSILRGLGELVDNKTKYWIKENLIKDTIFYLNLLV